MTDHQLQLLLAAKLPEKLIQLNETIYKEVKWRGSCRTVYDTEWDCIVRLVEEQNSWKIKYYNALTKLVRNEWKQPALASEVDVRAATASASWQQRATAMKECGII